MLSSMEETIFDYPVKNDLRTYDKTRKLQLVKKMITISKNIIRW